MEWINKGTGKNSSFISKNEGMIEMSMDEMKKLVLDGEKLKVHRAMDNDLI